MQVLVRSGVENGSPPLSANAPATTDVQRSPRKGTTSACTLRSACTGHEKRGNAPLGFRQKTRPSLGPLTRACLSPLQLRRGNSRRWRVRVGIAVGKTWATRRNRHRGRNERTMHGSPPVTASVRERAWQGQKRKGVKALVPARIVRAPGSVPVRRSSCRNHQATSGSKYTRQTRTKKCGQGRANGGLGRGERRRSYVGERVERNDESVTRIESDTTARDREETQGDVRTSSSGRNIAKSGAAVAGPGL